jgi:hypothetical protein
MLTSEPHDPFEPAGDSRLSRYFLRATWGALAVGLFVGIQGAPAWAVLAPFVGFWGAAVAAAAWVGE